MKRFLASTVSILVAGALLGGCASNNYPGQYGSQQSYPSSQPYPVAQPYPASQPYPSSQPYPVAQPYPASQTYPGNNQQYGMAYGVIDSIHAAQTAAEPSNGVGPLVGGVIGGLLGNQVGKGRGRAVATMAGIVGGAVVGGQIEQRNAPVGGANRYQVNVRLDNGGMQSFMQDQVYDLSVGSRVRIQNNVVYRY